MIIIQFIKINWHKDSRGGKKAEIRNKIPKVYKLPREIDNYKLKDKVIIHNVCYSFFDSKLNVIYNNYEVLEFHKLKDRHKQVLEISFIEKELEVSFKYLGHYCGNPFRYQRDERGKIVPLNCKAFKLKDNEYGQIEYNGRFSDYDTGNWWYELNVVNIIKEENINKNVFTNNKPDKTFYQLAKLR